MKNIRVLSLLAGCLCFGSVSLHAQQPVVGVYQPEGNDSTGVIFEKVEVEASVDAQLWRSHLQQQLGPIIENAVRRGLRPGQYVVNVRFLVEKDGSISSAKAMKDIGFGLAKGAEKVVKSGPKWTAGEQNGKKVRSYHTQPIYFVVTQ